MSEEHRNIFCTFEVCMKFTKGNLIERLRQGIFQQKRGK